MRLSVRSLLVLVLVLGGWLGLMVHHARVQREAVAAIERAGGTVRYDWQWKNDRPVPNGRPWWPTGLVDLLGVDYFGTVTYVNLYDDGSDDQLVQVGRLGRLESLNLGMSQVTDAGLVHLEGLTHLRVLSLIGTEIGDAGLEHLKGLTRLNVLHIENTRVTDAGLIQIEKLTELRKLGLAGNAVSNAGLAHLKGRVSLRELNLYGTRVTDAGVQQLRETLPNLKIIR